MAYARLTRNRLTLIVGGAALALIASLTTLYIHSQRNLTLTTSPQAGHASRNYNLTPFDLMDAYDACVLEAEAKLGSNLLRQHMLPLSTRFDDRSGEYIVVLSADVGTVYDWNEATIYCNINPVKQEVSYYKEVHEGHQSILSRTINALGSLFR